MRTLVLNQSKSLSRSAQQRLTDRPNQIIREIETHELRADLGPAPGSVFYCAKSAAAHRGFSTEKRRRRGSFALKQKGRYQMPFQNGQSGNPAGRPRGARNKRTLALENIMEDESEVITRKIVEMAKGGHIAAIRLIIDRMAPLQKDRPVDFELPPLNTPADAIAASAAIAAAVAAGDLTPMEAAQLSKVVHGYVQAVELRDFEKALAKLVEDGQNPANRS
jgi:hypothetical protein